MVRSKKLGGWYYPRSATLEELETVAHRLKNEVKMDYIVVSVHGRQLADELAGKQTGGNGSVVEKTLEMIKIFKQQKIDVVLMTLQDPRFGRKDELSKALEIVHGVLEICRRSGCSEIHFDIEPHTTNAWKKREDETGEQVTERRRKILQELEEVLTEIRGYVDRYTNDVLSGGLPLTSAPSNGELSNGTPATAALMHLPKPEASPDELEIKPTRIMLSLAVPWWIPVRFPEISNNFAVDCLYLMCYGECGFTKEEIFEKMLKKQRPFRKPTVVGIGVEEFKKGMGSQSIQQVNQNMECCCHDNGITSCVQMATQVDDKMIEDEEPAYLSPCLYSINHLFGTHLKDGSK